MRTGRRHVAGKILLALLTTMALALTACDNKAGPAPKQSDAGAEKPADGEGEGASDKNGAAAGQEGAEEGGDGEELPEAVKESRKYGHIPIAGETTPEAVMEKFKRWKDAREAAVADKEIGKKLGEVAPGAELYVFFGTWCADCHRELPRLWAAFEHAGGELPFTVKYVALDEQFQAADFDLTPYNIERIPTIIVKRDGKEVGRIIESTADPVERELLALLDGSKTGIVSNSQPIIEKYNLGGAEKK